MMLTITPTVKLASWFFLMLLHYKLVELGGATGISIDPILSTQFCSNSQVSVCPKPPTFDLVDLRALAGKWYEIGSTARFKLHRENGLACNSANYTVTSSAPNFWGVATSNLSIVDSGVTAIGPLGEYGITQISTASNSICQNARQICGLISTTNSSQLGQALTQLAATSGKLLLLHPVEASQLMNASASITAAISTINDAIDGLSKNVTMIQLLNAQLSQANGSVHDNLQTLNNVTAQTGFVQDAIQQAVKAIAFARGVVIQLSRVTAEQLRIEGYFKGYVEVAAKLLFAGGVDLPVTSVPELGTVMFLLAAAEQDIVTQAGATELALFGINAVTSLIAMDSTKPGAGVTSYTGSATQNGTFAGRLTADIHGTKAPFLILGVDGWATSGYSAALVYSCTEVPNAHYKQGLFVISRTPVLDQLVVNQLLDIASFSGIQTTCDDPFVYTLQDSPICLTKVSSQENPSP